MCASDEYRRVCQGVFIWKQSTHVAAESENLPRKKQFSEDSYAAVGLTTGGSEASGVYGNYFSYDDMFGINALLHKERFVVRESFESESWAKATLCPADLCTYYSGACVHVETGFCMDEVPGTAQCLAGFRHCNVHTTINNA
jgi:hypothetical protein